MGCSFESRSSEPLWTWQPKLTFLSPRKTNLWYTAHHRRESTHAHLVWDCKGHAWIHYIFKAVPLHVCAKYEVVSWLRRQGFWNILVCILPLSRRHTRAHRTRVFSEAPPGLREAGPDLHQEGDVDYASGGFLLHPLFILCAAASSRCAVVLDVSRRAVVPDASKRSLLHPPEHGDARLAKSEFRCCGHGVRILRHAVALQFDHIVVHRFCARSVEAQTKYGRFGHRRKLPHAQYFLGCDEQAWL